MGRVNIDHKNGVVIVDGKEVFRKTLPWKKRRKVYQAAIRLYISMQGDPQCLRKQLAVKGMLSSGRLEMADVSVEHGKLVIDNQQWTIGGSSKTISSGEDIERIGGLGGNF